LFSINQLRSWNLATGQLGWSDIRGSVSFTSLELLGLVVAMIANNRTVGLNDQCYDK
jgi:hypothetical protein